MGGSLPEAIRLARKGGSTKPRADLAPAAGGWVAAGGWAVGGTPPEGWVGATVVGVTVVQAANTRPAAAVLEATRNCLRDIFFVSIVFSPFTKINFERYQIGTIAYTLTGLSNTDTHILHIFLLLRRKGLFCKLNERIWVDSTGLLEQVLHNLSNQMDN
jgi:hypothetical protein